ncbi:MAG: DUF1345 domain-containing protein [Acetobacteraceae bacterium]
MPDYWDFVYFAFVLGMTFQVSDVQITSRKLRRLATAHGMSGLPVQYGGRRVDGQPGGEPALSRRFGRGRRVSARS